MGVYRQRWLTNKKRLQITYLAPLVLYWALLLFLFLTTGSPHSPKQVLLYSVFLIPVYLLVTAANAWLLLVTMYPVYTERRNGYKALIRFKPEPYTVYGSGNLYMKTGVPGFLFIEVGYKVFQHLDLIDEMVLEISPRTKILLGIKSVQEAGLMRAV